MKTRMTRIVLLSAVLAVSAISVTGAGEQKISKGKAVTKSVPFSVTGVYSGSLDGEILVNGQSVFVNGKTTVHRVGKGPVDVGTSVSKSAVLVSGVMKGKKAVATMIIIGDPETSDDFSQATVAGADRAPTSKDAR